MDSAYRPNTCDMNFIRTLHKLGISSASSHRNDLLIDSRKFSGNAQYLTKDRLLHHGTLLVQSNLDDLQSSLSVTKDKIQAKGFQSIRCRVTNISEHLGEKIPVEQQKSCCWPPLPEKMKN